jgi:mutator protein MutT
MEKKQDSQNDLKKMNLTKNTQISNDFSKNDKVELIVEALIKDDSEKILLLRRSENNVFFKNLWQLPGGKVEFGENVRDAIKREVNEEISCNANNVCINKVFSFKDKFNSLNETIFLMVFDVFCKTEIKLSSAHTEFGFFSIDEIKKMNLTKFSRFAIFGK